MPLPLEKHNGERAALNTNLTLGYLGGEERSHIGEGAAELIHIGQASLVLGGTLNYYLENVFNYPTLAEAYKVAALDAWNRLSV